LLITNTDCQSHRSKAADIFRFEVSNGPISVGRFRREKDKTRTAALQSMAGKVHVLEGGKLSTILPAVSKFGKEMYVLSARQSYFGVRNEIYFYKTVFFFINHSRILLLLRK